MLQELTIVRTVAELRRCRSQAAGRPVGFVPTMGALHAGHASLIRAAAEDGTHVVVSIFVNPTQFGPNEDLARYPRTLDADLTTCREAGASAVFVPDAAEMYPTGFNTRVEVAGVTETLEGAIRPGHFSGVATVVLKLLNMAQPDYAYFGAKDYQQQLLIKKMVADLNVPVTIVTRPTVREPDGLAMSSRNRYLSPEDRTRAVAISRALFAARDRLSQGETDLAAVRATMEQTIAAAGLGVDYAVIADADTLEELSAPRARMALLAAARLGAVRLIDNVVVGI